MCRWAAYCGAPIYLEEVVSRPGHSLINQSMNAAECKTVTNGDGFGLAWYGHRPEPGLYRDIGPAWSDTNLSSLAEQVQAPLFLAHVRATTGSAVARDNCHPFVVGRWSFMHNGQIGGFEMIRKQADMLVPDALYPYRRGTSDSEVLFLLALAAGLEERPEAAIGVAARQLAELSKSSGTAPHLRLSAAFSDGEALFAVRASTDEIVPTVYYRWSDSRNGWAVVSEPLELEEDDWSELPPGTIARFDKGEVQFSEIAL